MLSLPIVDAHIHLYDHQLNEYTFLEKPDPSFMELIGDYSSLPRKYLLENYLHDTSGYNIEGVIWYEFLSTEPIKEVKMANDLAMQSKIRQGLVALVDFLDPKLQESLEIYNSMSHVKGVREHLGWDDQNPKKRFAKRSDLLNDPTWKKGLALLNQYHFKCGLEIFSHQLPDLIKIIQQYPKIEFTIALMAWPSDINEEGFLRWKKDLKLLSLCENICVEIMALECIFGMNWTKEQATPWVLSTIEIFGTERCMFGSHMPIAKLSRSFSDLYSTYEDIVAAFSKHEKENLFSRVATKWFNI